MHRPLDLSGSVITREDLERSPRQLVGILSARALPGLADDELGQLIGVVQIDVSSARQEDKLHLHGTLACTMAWRCARCLQSFQNAVRVDVDRLYAFRADPARHVLEQEMCEDVVYLPKGIFSLNRMVEEELVLAHPMLPICSPGCKGMCAGCGADLNHETCRCPPEEPDSPFAVLKALRPPSP
jgi:uncharacterized protein